MQIHKHHISYDPEWTVDVPGYFHKTITWITRMADTEENYAMCISMLHALMHECNMRRMKLDREENDARTHTKLPRT